MHVSNCWTLPLQQLSVALHWLVCRRQMSPLGLQPEGFAQTPTGSLGFAQTPTGSFGLALLQTPSGVFGSFGNPPQQSVSLVQMSPTGLQPDAGWQMRTFVGPYGAQSRLQQSPPQAGTPLSMKPPSPPFCELAQSMPSIKLHCAPVLAGWPQRPNVLFCGIWQSPPQQSLLALQMSPF